MDIPNLEGQPGWVVVIVFALVVIGTLGTLWLKARVPHGEKPSVPELPDPPPALPLPRDTGENVTALQLVNFALNHLAETARREAQQGEEAEHKVEELRRQLEECKRELQIVQRRLEQCQENAHHLAQRAYEPRQNNG